MKGATLLRSMLAIGLYVALVALAANALDWVRMENPQHTPRYAYILCGPSSSLFTHEALFLLPLQSLVLLPWLLVGAAYPRVWVVCLAGFILCWLIIGRFMAPLF